MSLWCSFDLHIQCLENEIPICAWIKKKTKSHKVYVWGLSRGLLESGWMHNVWMQYLGYQQDNKLADTMWYDVWLLEVQMTSRESQWVVWSEELDKCFVLNMDGCVQPMPQGWVLEWPFGYVMALKILDLWIICDKDENFVILWIFSKWAYMQLMWEFFLLHNLSFRFNVLLELYKIGSTYWSR